MLGEDDILSSLYPHFLLERRVDFRDPVVDVFLRLGPTIRRFAFNWKKKKRKNKTDLLLIHEHKKTRFFPFLYFFFILSFLLFCEGNMKCPIAIVVEGVKDLT